MKHLSFVVTLTIASVCALPCLAQSNTGAEKPMPNVAQTSAAKPSSAFADYKKLDPKEPLVNWREANDRVRALEGHMGHVRGEAKPKPKASPAPEKKP